MKTTKKTIFEVSYNNLDDTITKFLKSKNFLDKNFDQYGYECVAENEWGNYQCHDFDVNPAYFSEEDKNDIKGLGTGEILNWMAYENLIEPGKYLVRVR